MDGAARRDRGFVIRRCCSAALQIGHRLKAMRRVLRQTPLDDLGGGESSGGRIVAHDGVQRVEQRSRVRRRACPSAVRRARRQAEDVRSRVGRPAPAPAPATCRPPSRAPFPSRARSRRRLPRSSSWPGRSRAASCRLRVIMMLAGFRSRCRMPFRAQPPARRRPPTDAHRLVERQWPCRGAPGTPSRGSRGRRRAGRRCADGSTPRWRAPLPGSARLGRPSAS